MDEKLSKMPVIIGKNGSKSVICIQSMFYKSKTFIQDNHFGANTYRWNPGIPLLKARTICSKMNCLPQQVRNIIKPLRRLFFAGL
jgi:hypothetical protein